MDFLSLINKYEIQVSGILNIGAHHGQELDMFQATGAQKVLCFEPQPGVYAVLRENAARFPNVECVMMALGDVDTLLDMHVSSNEGQSSSLLAPGVHTAQYPHITFHERSRVQVSRLDDILPTDHIFNVIYMDVQGYELHALRGASATLDQIDCIYTEVNNEELYEGCVRIDSLDEHLGRFGFARVETDWCGGTWGDAFYVKPSRGGK